VGVPPCSAAGTRLRSEQLGAKGGECAIVWLAMARVYERGESSTPPPPPSSSSAVMKVDGERRDGARVVVVMHA